jgi:hypothetical protein
MHLDLYTARQDEEVNRLLQLGARRYPWRYRPGSDFVVLQDPDGNSFCVVDIEQIPVQMKMSVIALGYDTYNGAGKTHTRREKTGQSSCLIGGSAQ